MVFLLDDSTKTFLTMQNDFYDAYAILMQLNHFELANQFYFIASTLYSN